MKNLYAKKLLILFITLLGYTVIHAQCSWTGCSNVSGACGAPGVAVGCGSFTQYNVGSGTFTYFTGYIGSNYTISTVGTGFDTQLSIYDYITGSSWTSRAYNDNNGPDGAGTAASVNFTAVYTGNHIAVVNRFNCQQHDFTGQSAILKFRENPPAAPPTPNGAGAACGGSATLTWNGSPAAGLSWFWQTSPTGTNATFGTSSYTVTAPGTYYLRSRSLSGCWGAASAGVTVTFNTNSSPPAGITGTTIICQGGSTTLNVSGGSLGTGANWVWYAGACGGTPIGTGTSINVSPSSTTTYFVRAEGTCNNTTCASATVTVNTNSNAPTGITGITTICTGAPTTLTVSGGSLGTGADWQWFAGSCASTVIGTGPSITVSPSSTTTYFVRAAGTCNTTTCASTTVTVNTLSSPATSIGGTTTICAGGSTTLSAVGGAVGTGGVWEWFASSCGSTPIGTGPSITVSPSSTTTYFVRATGNCGTTSCTSTTVTVNTPSSAPSAITGTSTICVGNSTTLSVSGGVLGTGASWTWYAGSCGGTPIGIGPSITVSPSANTTYFVRAEGACNNTACASTTVTVNTLSTAPTAISGINSICNGASTTLSVSGGSLGTGADWEWFAGSCGSTPIGTGASISVSPTSTTTYFVRAAGTCNTTTCASQIVNVEQPVAAAGAITGNTTVCYGATSVTYSIAGVTNATNYTWTVPSGASITAGQGTTSITIDFGTATAGSIDVTPSNSCFSGTPSSQPITITPLVTGTPVISGNATVCYGATSQTYTTTTVSGATGYTWTVPAGANITSGQGTTSITVDFGTATSGTISVAPNNSCFGGTTGNYNVTVTPLVAQAGPVAGNATVCEGATGVSYTIPVPSGATSYTWSVPSGATITGGQGSNTITVDWGPNSSGYVKVIPTNSCFNGLADSTLVTVIPSLSGTPSISGLSPVCEGAVGVSYSTTLITGATTYTWAVPTGATIASGQGTANITVDWGTATTGAITVTPSNSCFTGSTGSSTITVTPTVNNSSAIISGNNTVCYGATSVTYTIAGVTGATNYTWSVPSGATITAGQGTTSITMDWGTATSGNVSVVASNSCFTNPSVDYPVVVTPLVAAAGTITGNTPVCYGATGEVYSIATVSGATTYTWTVPAGATITAGQGTNSITVDWGTATTGTIDVVPSNACFTGTNSSTTISVVPLLGANGTITGNATVCYGALGEVYSTSTITGATTYTWSVPSGATIASGQGTNTISVDWGTATSGNVSVTASNSCFTNTTIDYPVTVTPQVVSAGTIAGNDTVCFNAINEVYTLASVGGATTYTWSVPTGATITSGQGTTSISVDWGTATSGSVSVQPTNACFSGTPSTLNVYVVPVVAASGTIAGTDTVCYGDLGTPYNVNPVSGATNYTWTLPSGATVATGQGNSNISVDWGTATSGPITVTPSNSCFTGASNQLNVYVTPQVDPAGAISGNATVCYGVTNQTYSIAAVNGATNYTWTVPTGATIVTGQGTSSILINWGTATSGTITVTPDNACFTGVSSSLNVTVTPQVAAAGAITGNTTVCEATTGVSYAINPVSGATNYTWTVPAGATVATGQGTNAITVDWGTATTGVITVVPDNSCFTGGSSQLNVTVVPILGAAGAISGNANVCANSQSLYTVPALPGATTYTWALPPGANLVNGQGSTSVVINWANANSGPLQVTPSNSCYTGTPSTLNVTVTPTIAATGTITGSTTVCEGSTSVNYAVTAVPGAVNYNWNVTGGGVISAGQGTASINVDWLTPVGGTVSITPTNSCFTGTTSSTTVAVTALPNTSITNPGSLCYNSGLYTFTAASTGGNWTGNGITNTTNGSFSPVSAGVGSHWIKYTNQNAGCFKTDSIQAIVNPSPDSSFTLPAFVCLNDAPMNFTPATSGGTWSGNGITNSSSGTFNPQTAGVGTTSITYAINNGFGCSATSTQSLPVNANPIVSFATVPYFCDATAPFNLSASPAGGSFSGSGITDAVNGTFDPSIVGSGNSSVITYTVNVNGCDGSNTLPLAVNPPPAASFTAPTTICQNAMPTNLTPTNAGGTFSGTGVTASGVFDPQLAGAGLIPVTYTLGTGACQTTSTNSIQVLAVTNPIVANPPIFCSGGAPTVLSATPNGGAWTGTGVDPITGIFSPAVAGVGVYQVSYNVVQNGCVGSDTVIVYVNPLPDATFAAHGQMCANGSPVQLVPNIGGGYFTGTGVTPGGLFDPAAYAPAGGNAVVTYVLTQSGCTDSTSQTLVVLPEPQPAFTTSQTGPIVTFTSLSQNTTNVTWDFGDNTYGTGSPVDHIYAIPGVYTVTVTASNACGSVTHSQDVVVDKVGFDPIDNFFTQVKAYPNPFTTQVGIEITLSTSGDVGYEILDMQGRQLAVRGFIPLESGVHYFDLSATLADVAQGTYLVRIAHSKGQFSIVRLIKASE